MTDEKTSFGQARRDNLILGHGYPKNRSTAQDLDPHAHVFTPKQDRQSLEKKMEKYLEILTYSIFIRNACNQIERDKVYSIAREACQQFVSANAIGEEDHLGELFLLESSIDELESSISSKKPASQSAQVGYKLAA